MMFCRFLDKCRTVFPFKNSKGYYIMATEKVHSVKHTPNDVTRYCDSINTSAEAPEKGHKKWVKQQGLKTNQGPEVSLTMMQHSLRKEGSALLCEAVQARIDDCDPGFEKDHWMKRVTRNEIEEPLRADRWYYKKMDKSRDDPEQSGF